jgi:hypothetical protein
MNRIYGSRGQVSVDRADPPVPPGTFTPIASLNKWSCSLARDRADVTAFGDTNKVSVQGLPDVKGALGGFLDTDDITILYIALGEAKVMLKLEPDTLVPTMFLSGLAFVDASIDVPANGPATVSGTWAAAGPWDLAPTEP